MQDTGSPKLLKFVVTHQHIDGIIVLEPSGNRVFIVRYMEYIEKLGGKIAEPSGRLYKVVEFIVGNSFKKGIKCASDRNLITDGNWITKRSVPNFVSNGKL